MSCIRRGKKATPTYDYEFGKNFKLAENCGIVSTCKYFIAYQLADGTIHTQYLNKKQEDLLPVTFLNGAWMLNSEDAAKEITGLKCFSSGTQRCEDFVNEDDHCYWTGCVSSLNITTEWHESGIRRIAYKCPENTHVALIYRGGRTIAGYISYTYHYEYCPPNSIWPLQSIFCRKN